jgi:hypothetical protein
MWFTKQLFKVTLSASLVSTPAAAQDRPFLFSISTPRTAEPHASMHVDTGFGERAFDLVESDRPEQRFGIQASLGRGVTLLARVGIASDNRDTQSSQQAELLYSLVRVPSYQGTLAAGLGMRHESAGTNVLIGRVIAGRNFSAWRLDGNLLFEKPFSVNRDAVDLITSFGIARRVLPALHLGLEVIGEDLEGFWEANEAEGGARLLAGPSIRIAPPSQHWQVSIAGGPLVHATRSVATSGAIRGLPASGGRNGYAARAALSYEF